LRVVGFGVGWLRRGLRLRGRYRYFELAQSREHASLAADFAAHGVEATVLPLRPARLGFLGGARAVNATVPCLFLRGPNFRPTDGGLPVAQVHGAGEVSKSVNARARVGVGGASTRAHPILRFSVSMVVVFVWSLRLLSHSPRYSVAFARANAHRKGSCFCISTATQRTWAWCCLRWPNYAASSGAP
jgi:hypothetical protein